MRFKALSRIFVGLVICLSLFSWFYINTHINKCVATVEPILPDTTQPIEVKPDVSIISILIHAVIESLPSAS